MSFAFGLPWGEWSRKRSSRQRNQPPQRRRHRRRVARPEALRRACPTRRERCGTSQICKLHFSCASRRALRHALRITSGS
jgi:hypothetical protein